MARVAVIFGQFGVIADPMNLPHFRDRLAGEGIDTILVQHTETQRAYDFLNSYNGKIGIVGASLGAGVAPVIAGYLHKPVAIVGGFQPSNYDPVMHPVDIHDEESDETITRAVTVPANVEAAVCFRNPSWIGTAGLGHATYVIDPSNTTTKLTVYKRYDAHPGDFGGAQDIMVQSVLVAVQPNGPTVHTGAA